MTTRELAAAGITDPRLQAAYLRCRELNALHGRTYFLATRLLTADRRPAVHALYGFARWADDIVDDLGDQAPVAERARALDRLQAQLETGLATGRSSEPVVAALADTAERYGIEHRHFTDFMASMRMDLATTDYATWDDLAGYVHGSAAVIGLQVLPVLGTCAPRAEAAPHAASLGIAFQLTNFLRDVGEDLDRGRVYLPADRLAAHGVDHERLAWCRKTGERDERVVAALRELVAFNRDIYRHAALGVPMLAAVSRPCVSTALVLYSGILDRIEAADYAPVLRRRVVVPEHRRAAVALAGLLRVTAARTRHRLAARPAAPQPMPPRPASARPGTRESLPVVAEEPLA